MRSHVGNRRGSAIARVCQSVFYYWLLTLDPNPNSTPNPNPNPCSKGHSLWQTLTTGKDVHKYNVDISNQASTCCPVFKKGLGPPQQGYYWLLSLTLILTPSLTPTPILLKRGTCYDRPLPLEKISTNRIQTLAIWLPNVVWRWTRRP